MLKTIWMYQLLHLNEICKRLLYEVIISWVSSVTTAVTIVPDNKVNMILCSVHNRWRLPDI